MTYLQPTEPSYSTPAPTGTFRGGAQELCPPWLLNWAGARYVYSQAIQLDATAELLRLGVLQRFPEYAQPGALPYLGRDKGIFRGLTESDENYARRLRQFKSTWRFAGNAPTLLRQLWELQRPHAVRMRYVVNGYTGPASSGTQFADWWTCEGDVNGDPVLTYERVSPSNWDWDGSYGKNIRFWIIIYRTDFEPAVWGVPPYSWAEPGLSWGADPDSSRDWIADTFAIVRKFKAAGSHMGPFPGYNGGLIIADPDATAAPWGPAGPFAPSYSPGYPMPDGTFASYGSRPPGAIYVSGL